MPVPAPYEPYHVTDDATLIGKFIDEEWALSPKVCKKPILAYTPDTDMDTFGYEAGDILCVITYDLNMSTVKGISFDGYSEVANITLTLRSRSDSAILKCSDEIERILANHAVEPGNNWNLLTKYSFTRIFPSRKFSQRQLVFTLRSFWKPRLKP